MKRLIIYLVTIVAAGRVTAEPARNVSRATDVPAVWSAAQHLYVKGNVLPEERLAELEAWLDARATNWTVVLCEHAGDESFHDKEGSRFTGMDAVEHGLGKTLPAETGFGELKHLQTGERSGAFFVIFLRERKFSYYGSDVYDRRGLGEGNFNGNLDAPAIRAMRGGGRVADAVKDTVSFLDGELARRLAGEAEERRRGEERVRRAREETAATIAALRGRLTEARAAEQEIRRGYPAAKGSLLTQATGPWARQLDAAEASLSAGRNDEAVAAMRGVEQPLEAYLRLLADHARGPELIAGQQRETDALRLHEDSARAQAALLESREALKESVAAHANADASWSAALAVSAKLLQAAAVADTETRREAEELVRVAGRARAMSLPAGSGDAAAAMENATAALETARRDFSSGQSAAGALQKASGFLTDAERAGAVWERNRLIRRRAWQTGGIVGGGLVLAGGIIGNRRRRRVRTKALSLLEAWEKAFREKTEGLFKLMERTRTSVGTTAILESSGWTGDTAAIAHQTIRDVDQLFVMSSAIDGVLERSRGLALPRNLLATAVNFVAGKRYDDAVQLLNEDRISFSPEDPLRPVPLSAPDAVPSEWRGLLGKREDTEPFSLTFDELITAFNERAARALGSLDRIDIAWLRISADREKLNADLDGIELMEQQLHDAALTDRLFLLEPLFAALLPSARADQAGADRMAAKDPVQAMEKPLAAGARKAADAKAICGVVRQARAELLPRIREAAAELVTSGRRTVWVDEALTALSEKAGAIARAAVDEVQTAAVAALAAELNLQGVKVRTAADLMKRAAESCLPVIGKSEDAVRDARVQLGGELSIPPEKVLCEDDGRNPSVKLAAAREQHAASLAEIDRGDTAAAAEALNACDACCAAAAALITATREAFTAWPEQARMIAAETVRLSGTLPQRTEQLRRMETAWAASALISATGDTLSNNIRDVESLLEQARRKTAESKQQRESGLILTAAGRHGHAEGNNEQAAAHLDEIGAHEEKLTQAAAGNQTLAAELDAWRRRVAEAATQTSAMRRSVDRMREINTAVDHAVQAAAAAGTTADPFLAAQSLESCRTAMQELERQLTADAALHNDAVLSVKEAERQFTSLNQLAARSQQDQIPDSGAISQIVQSLPPLDQLLQTCRRRLTEPHEDWPQIDSAADGIAAEAVRLRSVLSGELEQAEESIRGLQRAASAIRSLRGWSGPFGVSIDSGAGQRGLYAAREALDRGAYAEAARLANAAAREAQNALEAAEAEERRRRREQERREEEARRERQRLSSASSSFGSSSGGFSSSSRSSSSSGTSRSSFSSGSGTSRSGW